MARPIRVTPQTRLGTPLGHALGIQGEVNSAPSSTACCGRQRFLARRLMRIGIRPPFAQATSRRLWATQSVPYALRLRQCNLSVPRLTGGSPGVRLNARPADYTAARRAHSSSAGLVTTMPRRTGLGPVQRGPRENEPRGAAQLCSFLFWSRLTGQVAPAPEKTYSTVRFFGFAPRKVLTHLRAGEIMVGDKTTGRPSGG
jgi:hypothetical protein